MFIILHLIIFIWTPCLSIKNKKRRQSLRSDIPSIIQSGHRHRYFYLERKTHDIFVEFFLYRKTDPSNKIRKRSAKASKKYEIRLKVRSGNAAMPWPPHHAPKCLTFRFPLLLYFIDCFELSGQNTTNNINKS